MALAVAAELKLERGMNPLVLNMASSRRPGGGYKTGAGAQEGMFPLLCPVLTADVDAVLHAQRISSGGATTTNP